MKTSIATAVCLILFAAWEARSAGPANPSLPATSATMPAAGPAMDLDEAAKLLAQKVGGKWELHTQNLGPGRDVRYVEGTVAFTESRPAWNQGRAPVYVFPFAPDAEGRRIIAEFYVDMQAPFKILGVGRGRMAVSWADPSAPDVRKVMEVLELQPPAGGPIWPGRFANSQPDSASTTQPATGPASAPAKQAE
jgi:hypothetical protein